jgi:hypothetical protein
MPILSNEERAEITRSFMAETSDLGEDLGITKVDIRAAVDATDDWRVANASSANQALPLPFRSVASAAQKSRVMTLVIARAYQTGA